MAPHAVFAQPAPATVHVTEVFGIPALAMCAVKVCNTPSSTLAFEGVTLTETSLVIVTDTDALAAESA
jgi:hypothetical protein